MSVSRRSLASRSSSAVAPASTPSRASPPAASSPAIDRDEYDVVPIGIATDGRWVLESGDTAAAGASTTRTSCPRWTARRCGGRAWTAAPEAPTWSSTSRGTAAHALGRGRRGLPAAARPVRRGRHHPGAARDGRACATSAPGCWRRRSAWTRRYMKVVLAAAGPAGAARRRAITDRAVAHRSRRRAAPRVEALGYPVVRQAGPRRVEHRHLARCTTPCELDAADRRGPAARPQGARRGRGRGCPRDRVRGPRVARTGPPETSVPAEITVGGDHEFYDFAAKYLPEEAHRARRARRPRPDETDGGAARPVRAGLRGALLRGAGPRRLLPDARRLGGHQRAQHDAGLHPAVDVPADVGRHRPRLPGRWSTGCAQARLRAGTGLRWRSRRCRRPYSPARTRCSPTRRPLATVQAVAVVTPKLGRPRTCTMRVAHAHRSGPRACRLGRSSAPGRVRSTRVAAALQGGRATRPHDAPVPGDRGVGTRGGGGSDVHHRAGQRAGDAVDGLHLGDDQLAELVDVAGLGAHDDVVGTGDVLGQRHALDLARSPWRRRRPCRRRSGSGCRPARPCGLLGGSVRGRWSLANLPRLARVSEGGRRRLGTGRLVGWSHGTPTATRPWPTSASSG